MYEKLLPYIQKRKALEVTLTLFNFDNETAPIKASEQTAKIMSVISNEYFDLILNQDVQNIIQSLNIKDLDDTQKAIVKEWQKSYEQLSNIPREEYLANEELLVHSRIAWLEAKEQQDYNIFKPYLEKVINYQKKFASYRLKNQECLYDVLLDDYEEGFTTKIIDDLFSQLKKHIVPLLKEIQNSKYTIPRKFIYQDYAINSQRELSTTVAKMLGFDFDCGKLCETEHPYTTELHNRDVRITTHYYSNNLESGLYSTIHETGHGLYEQGISDDIALTSIGHGASMGIHESQSRFYENNLGRSYGFIQLIYPIIQNLFSHQLNNVSVDEFYHAINHVEASLIRTEADELTYPLHIMIRYELEKQLFNDEITVEQLPQKWNQMYQDYLGVEVPNDSLGILQDIHWSEGSFGYFFTYTIGSAIASQIEYYLKKQFNFESRISQEDLNCIREILKNNIHQYGAKYNTNELLLKMTGEVFNPKYYIQYLKNKFTKIYELDSCKS